MKQKIKSLLRIVSLFFYKYPTLYFSIYKIILVPLRLLDIKTFSKHVNKINWLFNFQIIKHTKESRLYFSEIDDFSELDIINDITVYYKKNNANTSGHWQENIDSDMKDLHESLLSSNSDVLCEIYGNMFRQKELHGISAADFYDPLPHRYLYLKQKILNDIHSFSEFLATSNVDCPEQSRITPAFRDNLAKIIHDIETSIDSNISFPSTSGAFGLLIDEKLITNESIRHIYSSIRLSRLSEILKNKGPLKILEIGAGYGGFCYYFSKLNHFEIEKYDIIDLPVVNTFQYYFLSNSLERNVSFFDCKHDDSNIILYPNTHLHRLTHDYDLIINHDSFPEMPEDVVTDYVNFIGQCSGAIFYSFNHECNAYDRTGAIPQTNVKKIFSGNKLFQIIQRERSWVREGYVEETYSIK